MEHRHLLRSLTPSFTLSKQLQESVCASSPQTVFYHTNMEHIPLHEENSHISVVLLELYRFFIMSEKPFHCCSGCCHLFFSGPTKSVPLFLSHHPLPVFHTSRPLARKLTPASCVLRVSWFKLCFQLKSWLQNPSPWPTGGARHNDPSGTTVPSE